MNQKELVMKKNQENEEDREFNEKREKIMSIVEAYNSGDDALRKWSMEQMLKETQGFIGKIINKHFYNYKADYYQEMYQAGVLAVLENMGRYDASKGTLTTYFTSYILHEITNYISEETNHSTPYYANMMVQIKEAIKYYESKHKTPTPADISIYTKLSIRNVQEGLNRINALDEFRYDNESDLERQLAEEHRGYCFDLPEDRVIHKELMEALSEAISSLCEEDRLVLFHRFGIMDGKQKSYNLISKELNIPVNIVMQRYTRGIRILQNDQNLQEIVNPTLKKHQQNVLDNPLSISPTDSVITLYAELDGENEEDMKISILPSDKKRNHLLISF